MTTRARRIVPLRDSKGELDGSPSKHDFELLKLERELNYFRAEFTRLRAAIRDKDLQLKAQEDLWHLGLDFGEWPTMEGVNRNLTKLRSALGNDGSRIAIGTGEAPGKQERPTDEP